jgi:hypothetical protein
MPRSECVCDRDFNALALPLAAVPYRIEQRCQIRDCFLLIAAVAEQAGRHFPNLLNA